MKVNDLVKPHRPPIDGIPDVPEGTYGVVKEIDNLYVKVQFGSSEKRYTYYLYDLTSIDS
jgi:hypothetical protein